jgi:hypothetical protein
MPKNLLGNTNTCFGRNKVTYIPMHSLNAICVEEWQPIEKDPWPAKASGPVLGANGQDINVKGIHKSLAGVNYCQNRVEPT